MNTENLLKEIDSEKEKMASEVELNDKELIERFYLKDSILLLCSLAIIGVGMVFYADMSKTYSIGFVITAFTCALSPMFPLILSCFETKNLSFSYHFKSIFRKEKFKKNIVSEKKKVAYRKKINPDFLKKIALNMEKTEFKHLLIVCDGSVTLEKLEIFISEDYKNRIKRANHIEELTTLIYEENKNLILENKRF